LHFDDKEVFSETERMTNTVFSKQLKMPKLQSLTVQSQIRPMPKNPEFIVTAKMSTRSPYRETNPSPPEVCLYTLHRENSL